MKSFIRGSTFQQVGQFGQSGSPVDCTGWTVTLVVSTAAAPVTQIATLNLTWIDQTIGAFNVTAGDTSNWPVGKARIDCKVVDNFGTIVKSEPSFFRIGESPI